MGFSTVKKDVKEVNGFIRSNKDNTLFKDIQIKDLKPLLTDDCINFVDGDGFCFKVSSSAEEDYIEVKNNNTGEVRECSNISEWKGRSRKEGAISIDSVLGRENIKREAKGLKPFEISDFTVTKKKRLKFENGTKVDGIRFENSFEVAKYYLKQWIEAVKIQTQVPNILITIGKGKSHRNFVHTPLEYKSNRTGERPLLLDAVRTHLLETYPSDEAPKLTETDEIVDMRAFEHYLKFRKTNRISGIKTSFDKDARCTPGFLFDPTKDFHFKQPQVWLIHSSDKSVGELELVKSGMKFTALMGTAYQMCISDNSDFYGSRLTMPPEMKPDISYGDVAFYKDFINLTTPKDVLQKIVDVFLMFYPSGVSFKSHLGVDIDEDTLWWCQQCFACQYMWRKMNDPTKFVDLLNHYKVDYSKLVGNHKPPTLPLQPEQSVRDVIELQRNKLRDIIESASDTKGTKQVLIGNLNSVTSNLKELEESLSLFFVKE